MKFDLPWPPSANHLYATVRGRRVLCKAGREYHEAASVLVLAQGRPVQPLAGRIRLEIHAYPPDARRRDLSNLVKVVEDSLTKAGVWEDDCQIDDLRVVRAGMRRPEGKIVVVVSEV